MLTLLWSALVVAASPVFSPGLATAAAGCARAGERLTACEPERVAWPDGSATDVVFCQVAGKESSITRRTAVLDGGKRLGCLALEEPIPTRKAWATRMTLSGGDLTPGSRVLASKQFAGERLLLFVGWAYGSSYNPIEIVTVKGGRLVQLLAPEEVAFHDFEDLDGDGFPEVRSTEGGCQTNCCYTVEGVRKVRDGKYRLDPALMERWAKEHRVPWFGPTPADDDPSNAFVKKCQEDMARRANEADAEEPEQRKGAAVSPTPAPPPPAPRR